MSQIAVTAEQKLREIQSSYLKKVPSLILELENLYSQLSVAKDLHPALLELKRKSHSFIGSTGTFEFHDLSKKTREFEKILLSISENSSQIESNKLDKLWSHLVAIKGLAQRITHTQQTTPNIATEVTPLFVNRPLNILFAGDDEQIQEKLVFDLNDSGHTITIAANGEEAVEKFNNHEFDLVVLEILMPKMDGFQAAIQIKSQSEKKYVPILFLTSANREEDLVKCIESGGDDFLIKPYQPGILNAKIFSLDRVSQLINKRNNCLD